MRRILLSLLMLSFTAAVSFGQNNFYYPAGTTVDEAGLAPASESTTLRFLKNQANDPITFKWRVIRVDTLQATAGTGGTVGFGVCDNLSCYSNFVGNDFTMDEVPAIAAYGAFKLQSFSVSGDVKVVVCVKVWDVADSTIADTVCLSWSTDNYVSVEEFELQSEISVFPNPATNVLNVTYDLASTNEGSFELINLVGSTVYTKTLTEERGEFELNIEKLARGVYFYAIKNDNGKVLSTKKLVVD